MKIAYVLAVAVVMAVSASPALADSNGVEIACGIESSYKVSIKAYNNNSYPMKCTATCTIKNGSDAEVEVKITDKDVAVESSYQTLLEENMTEGPYKPHELDYSCKKP